MVDEPSNEKKGAHLIISLSSFPSSSSSSLGLEDRIVPFGVSQSFSLLLRRSVRIGYCRLNVGTILVAHLYNKVVEKSHWLDGSSKAQLDQAQVLKPSRSSPAGATEGKDALVELFVQLRLREHNPPRNKSQMKQSLTNISFLSTMILPVFGSGGHLETVPIESAACKPAEDHPMYIVIIIIIIIINIISSRSSSSSSSQCATDLVSLPKESAAMCHA